MNEIRETVLKNRYKLTRLLANNGGQGITYIAEDLESSSHGKCVVKQLDRRKYDDRPPEYLNRAIERFKREANMMEALSHPQIPKFLDHFNENEDFYLVQEFIEGHNFKQELETLGCLSEFQLIAFLEDVLKILVFIHDRKIIHRDLKPANLIWQRYEGRMILIDFGIVKEISPFTNENKLTRTGEFIGTPSYAAPETMEGKSFYSSDLYSLGLMAIEALIGRSPNVYYNGEVHWKNQGQASEELSRILNRMVGPSLSDRYQSAQEVLEDLQPLSPMGKTVGNKYKVLGSIRYLNSETFGHSYLAQSLENIEDDVSENSSATPSPKRLLKELRPIDDRPIALEEARRILNEEGIKLEQLNSNPDIPKIFDWFEEKGRFYVVYEWIEGNDLTQEITQDKPWSQMQAIALLQETLKIIEAVHAKDVAHLDLKPSKLMRRSSDGKICLLDLGKVKKIASLSLTSQGSIVYELVGTEGYCPPEQRQGNPSFNSDIYALGMTVIQALTGIRPDNIERKNGSIVWNEEISIHPKFRKILERMVHLDSVKRGRYQSASEVLPDIHRLPKKLDTSSYLNTFKLPKKRLKKWVKPWSISIAVVLASFLGVVSIGFQRVTAIQSAIKSYQEGLNFAEKGEHEQAIEFYNNALSFQAKFPEALVAKSISLGALNFPPSVRLKLCEDALDIRREFTGALNCIGDIKSDLGKADSREYAQAIDYFERAIEIESKLADPTIELMYAYYNKGETLAEWGKKAEANLAFEKALEAAQARLQNNPNDSKAITIKNEAQRQLKQ